MGDKDKKWIEMAFRNKDALPSKPVLSDFRVYSIITFEHQDGTLDWVTGTNSETTFVGTGICAERNAVVQLRHIPYGAIVAVYVVSDSPAELTPGLLCREFLLEYAQLDTPVVRAWRPGPGPAWQSRTSTLGELYPHPPLFLHVRGSAVLEFGRDFAKTAQPLRETTEDSALLSLYARVVAATAKDNKDELFAVRMAGGALFENGNTRVLAQTKLGEFGHSLDPITKMVPFLEEYKEKGIGIRYIITTDQWGNLHSPVAPARAHLYEGGHACTVFVHDRSSGRVLRTSAAELAPDLPKVEIGLGAADHNDGAGAAGSAGSAAGVRTESKAKPAGSGHRAVGAAGVSAAAKDSSASNALSSGPRIVTCSGGCHSHAHSGAIAALAGGDARRRRVRSRL